MGIKETLMILESEFPEDREDIQEGEHVKCSGSLLGACHITECAAFFGHPFKEHCYCKCTPFFCKQIEEEVSCIRIRG